MAAAVAPNIAGIDVAGAEAEAPSKAGVAAAAAEAMPKATGGDAGAGAAAGAVLPAGSGVLTARAKGADGATEAVLAGVLAGVLGNWKPPEAAGAAGGTAGVSPKDGAVLGAPACNTTFTPAQQPMRHVGPMLSCDQHCSVMLSAHVINHQKANGHGTHHKHIA